MLVQGKGSAVVHQPLLVYGNSEPGVNNFCESADLAAALQLDHNAGSVGCSNGDLEGGFLTRVGR